MAGIGKSRLAWEFEKYLDGLVANVWWHRGRCLAYGDAIAYWALAEMVRMRALITEDEAADSAVEKLSTAIVTHVSDADERAFIEPRLQHLLGLTDRTAPDREDLFSALRLFFERMAESGPVLLLFEDLQWADTALVEFVDYLLEWSRSFPIFVITLARPELADRHANWGASTRSFTSLFLEPLATESIDEILRGLVPGLPDESIAKIRDRADGIPLYAVETVRMLLDRGVLERHGDEYRPVGAIEALDVPESLQALIAARLDGLDPEERRLLGDASVLGKTFLPRGLAALSGLSDNEIQPLLASLVRKEVLVLDSDPRSPERGQFGFLQALVQRVAYETLARRDRKAKHLAAAQYLAEQAGIDPDEIAEVIAAHYLDAYHAAPDDADASELRASALEWLKHAAERAAALAATDDAQRALDAASELADTPLERAALLERAGGLALAGNRPEAAEERLRTAYQLFDEAGATHDAARVAAGLGMPIWNLGRIDEAIELMENAFAVLASDEPDADVAMLTAQLGRLHYFAGNLDTARERIELALETAEELDLPGVLAGALNTKSLILQNRPHESHALLREALEIALSHDLVFDALRAYNNLLVRVILDDRRDDVGPLTEEALLLARRRGDRFWEVRFRWGLIEDLRNAGEWDRLLAEAETLPAVETADTLIGMGYCMLARVCFDRGDDQRARGWLSLIAPELDEDASDFQARGMVLMSQPSRQGRGAIRRRARPGTGAHRALPDRASSRPGSRCAGRRRRGRATAWRPRCGRAARRAPFGLAPLPAHEVARVPARTHSRQCSRGPGRRSGGGRRVRARPRQRPQRRRADLARSGPPRLRLVARDLRTRGRRRAAPCRGAWDLRRARGSSHARAGRGRSAGGDGRLTDRLLRDRHGLVQERIPRTLKAGTGRANPFRVNAPTSSASTSSSTSACVRWLTRIWPPVASSHRREARM